MRKYALLVCLVFSGFLLAGPALAGSGGEGNVNVTSDTSCPGTVGTDNQISSGETINVWLSPSTPTTDSLTWTLTSENDIVNSGTLTFVCLDTTTGFNLWTTSLSGGSLSTNFSGNGNKSSESYTLSVFDNDTGTNVGGDSFRRVV